ncbi:MAG: PHP domain-containing protein [Ignavibacteriales bacterium]|nr:PHP domain-containing protein [Ignavibacteriales bacterium]MCB9210827.1 PHP domain-containing protein [Ignavibacteriales bacterium]MCB9217877.1 PHP domain-containing protein [Ignavibacteriales bacterium]
MYEYVGVIHVHSKFSDGSGDAGKIAETANEVGLDYLILTDHNTLRALHEGFENWYGNTLMLVGCELNDKVNKNHYLAMDIKDTFSTRLSAEEYVKKVHDCGGIGFIAHPHEERNSMKEHPPYPWIDWDIGYFNGIEIWNHMSEWMEGLTDQNKYNHFIHPLKSITAPPAKTLKKWDELNLKRKVVGIGGVDAHAHKINVLGFVEVEIFPYKVLFKSIRTHILTSKKLRSKNSTIENSKNLIYESLKNGRCFVANSYHGNAKGFKFFAKNGRKIYQMGDTIKLNGKIDLKVVLPNKIGNIRLFQNGKLIDSIDSYEGDFFVKEEGIYRVEVYLDNKAWIFSNHIRIEI